MCKTTPQRYGILLLTFVIGLTFVLSTAQSQRARAQRMTPAPSSMFGQGLNAKHFDVYDAASVAKVVQGRATEMQKDESIGVVDQAQLIRTVNFLNKVRVDGLDVHGSDGAMIKTIVNMNANILLNKILKKPIVGQINLVSVENLAANVNQRNFIRAYWHSRDTIFKAVQDNQTRAQVIAKLLAHYLKFRKIVIENTGLQNGEIKLYFKSLLNDGQKILIAQDMVKITSFVLSVEKADHKSYWTSGTRKSLIVILDGARTALESLNPNLLVAFPTGYPQTSAGPLPTPYSNITQTTNYSNGYKFDPPVILTTVRYIGPQVKFQPGESLDNNVWTRAYESFCGIKLKTIWSVTDYSNFDLKITTAIAVNTLPDIVPVYSTLFFRIADAGKAKDLTPYYNQYLDPELKFSMEKEDGGNAYKTCYRNNQLAAIAMPAYQDTAMQWIRQDWLEKYNKQWPANINESLALMKFFCKKKPAGNTTYAFPLTSSIDSGFPSAFGAYRNMWITDGKGGLMRSDLSIKWKPVLSTLQDLHADDYIDNNFPLNSQSVIDKQMANQQFGFYFGNSSSPASVLFNSVKKNLKANWQQGLITDERGAPTKVQVESRIFNFSAVSKNSHYPEALMFLANVYGDLANGIGVNYKKYYSEVGSDNISYDTFIYPLVNMSVLINDTSSKISTALKTSNFSKLSGTELVLAGRMKQWIEKKSYQGWKINAILKYKGSASTRNESLINNLTMPNNGWGPETPTWISKGPDLDMKSMQMFVQIIRGDLSVEEGFAELKQYFNANGGAEATAEINAWWQAEGNVRQYIS